jgi:heat shock protein HslJ
MMSVSGFTSATERYIRIDTPVADTSVDPAVPLTVRGTGKGLFEGNVVIGLESIDGRKLARVATTLRRDNSAAAGTWQTLITIPRPAPDTFRLVAYSPSPKEGDITITSEHIVLRNNAPGFELRDWQLQQYLGDAGEMSLPLPATLVSATFNKEQINGSAGCNRYFGAYSRETNNRLTLTSAIVSTQMACEPAVSAQEQRYLALLALVSGWQRQGESLLLLDEKQRPIVRFIAAEPVTLEHTLWQARGINNGRGGVVTSNNTRLATAVLVDGKISGNAGCNRFTATYEINNGKITIGPAMTTRKHCLKPDRIMQQEQQYLDALARAHTYIRKQDTLELRDRNGSLLVGFHVQEH